MRTTASLEAIESVCMKTVSAKYYCYCEILRIGQLTLQLNHEKGEEGKGTIPDFKRLF